MAGNIRILDTKVKTPLSLHENLDFRNIRYTFCFLSLHSFRADELDAEEDEREPPTVTPSLTTTKIRKTMNSMLDAEEDEREPVDGDAVSDGNDEEDGFNFTLLTLPSRAELAVVIHLLICNDWLQGCVDCFTVVLVKPQLNVFVGVDFTVPPRPMDLKKTRQYMAKVQLRGKTRQNERLQVVKHEGDDFDDPDLPN
ncbi:hypothetical protein RHMOL_Rhmol06G0190000 [Rhododendron molle]|uniref:Uncharacterized protein n=1 Tax=Rhododendron molle TaxID=49168 RepID=A0ACC0NFA9_RHOML|nr:hypothetical protein RHMOL_Rhmol06G0190000 [Rhododendron molle]